MAQLAAGARGTVFPLPDASLTAIRPLRLPAF